jgi:formate--tetrahydrofolate ligase
MLLIRQVADELSIPDDYLEYYGRYTAKLRLELLDRFEPRGKLILVTAITPTSHGEGKTVVSIGLTQALRRLGRKAVATLREPSLGPVFGLKGGATGGGQSQVLPADMINLHFNGDIHAISAAHNLLAALIDAHLHHSNALRIDVDHLWWPRTMDMNDRALRETVIGLGGKANGVPRETGFVITAASEVMALLALAADREDLRRRLSNIAIGLDLDGKVVTAGALRATGAMMVLLNEALMPNLVQTTEGAPALIHAGPFANIAHGTASLIAQRMGVRLAEYAVNETGFAADLGAEKYFDVVLPQGGIPPAAAVLIASARALVEQGGGVLREGFENLDRHIANLRRFGVPVVVAVNRFADDPAEQLEAIERHCAELGVRSALTDVYVRGGAGGEDLARAVMEAAAEPSSPRPLYGPELSLEEKTRVVATEVYGAGGVHFEGEARKKLRRYTAAGYSHLPVCMAKTQSSLTDNPKVLGAPTGWTLTVTDAYLSAGAGFVVVIAGNMMRMPGLGRDPQAFHMDVTEGGTIVGLR